MRNKRKRREKAKSKLDIAYNVLDALRLILVSIVVASLLLVFVVRKEEVKGTSMHPTLQDGESVIINMAANYVGEIRRFDVVVAKEYQSDELWVKRVIGLPNETISYHNGVLFVDGVPTEEPFLDEGYMEQVKKATGRPYFTEDYTSETLGEDEYLLVGDNRGESLDSRNASIGPFKREQIIARGVFVYAPLSNMRYVGNGG